MTTPSDASQDDLVTIQFVYQNTAYTIDLDPAEAEAFDQAMAPYTNAARHIGGAARPPR